ncbi:MAG: DEAD/DEAH box helicase, partial [Anaerolineae bacterium]|nr:DEAD/DEAH box helicase [Anaerolineae bacterium]NIO00092.1 DEAD/DEAH box helicase [Anaerolineae bacterium]NIQ80507.1 DEAD/DEAH box helicase [Anaerolineae bacterium]
MENSRTGWQPVLRFDVDCEGTLSLALDEHQLTLVRRTIEGKVFLEGPAGTGKTTAAVGRLLHFLEADIAAERILIIVPQRTLARPYYEALQSP